MNPFTSIQCRVRGHCERERISLARRSKLIRGTFCSSEQTDGQVLERTERKLEKGVELPTCIHTYMEQRWESRWDPFGPILIGEFLATFGTTTRWYASGLHQYGLRVIPCKPREAFFLSFLPRLSSRWKSENDPRSATIKAFRSIATYT